MIKSGYFLFACMLSAVVLSCGQKPSKTEAQPPGASPLEPFTVTTLDNGLEVIVKEVHTAPIVAVYLWCNTGSINEEPAMHGISHFYEHMFFKGTGKRGVGEIDRAIKNLGGYNNAFTSKEYTAYYVVLPAEKFSLAADVLVDAIRNSLFPLEEIEKERGVIKEEINRKDDDPPGTLYEEMFKLMFPETPYAHPVLGTKETVSAITRDDFRSYLSTFYVPNNMYAVVVGDVKAKDVADEFRKLTKGWKPDPDVASNLVAFKPEKRPGIQGFTLEKDVNTAYVMMAFQTAGNVDPKQNSVLDAVSSILGEGRSSRLYQRFVEREQLVSSVQAFIYPLTHAGLFVIYATMDPSAVPAFKAGMIEEIDRLHKEPVSAAELDKVKTMLKADFAFSNETDSNIGQTIGHFRTLGILDYALGYENTIDAVTPTDISRVAADVLDPGMYTIGVITPRTQASGGGEQ